MDYARAWMAVDQIKAAFSTLKGRTHLQCPEHNIPKDNILKSCPSILMKAFRTWNILVLNCCSEGPNDHSNQSETGLGPPCDDVLVKAVRAV